MGDVKWTPYGGVPADGEVPRIAAGLVPAAAANSYCGWDCAGYSEEPTSGHLWPGELRRLRAERGGR